MLTSRRNLVIAAVGLCFVLLISGSVVASDPPNDRVIKAAAQTYGLDPADLQVLNTATANLPLTGRQLTQAKLLHFDGNVYGTALDEEGQVVDPEAFFEAERAARQAKYGKFTPELYDFLASAAPDQPVEVAFWLHADTSTQPRWPDMEMFPTRESLPGQPKEPDVAPPVDERAVASEAREAELKALEAEHDKQMEAWAAATQAPFLSALESQGFRAGYTDRNSPLVFATLPASAVGKLSDHPDVAEVYLNSGREQEFQDGGFDDGRDYPFVDYAHNASRIPPAWNQGYSGVDGIGIVECCGDVQHTNKYLLLGALHGNYWNHGCLSEHATNVAGIMVGHMYKYLGTAYNAPYTYDSSCTGNRAEVLAAMDNVNGSSGEANYSGGSCQSGNVGVSIMDKGFDDDWRNHRDFIGVAAGNTEAGVPACDWVGSPAQAYNVMAVGSYFDNNTNSWADDAMSSFSAWKDPSSTNGDREKPEIIASGQGIWSTITTSPYWDFIGDGTSFSAPQVTAIANLLRERDSTLGSWPECVKAILMASAYKNIHDGQLFDAANDYDGAGSVIADRALLVAGNGWFRCRSAASADFPIQYTFNANAGQKIRVALVWDTNTDYVDYNNRPSVDLDLELRDPGGATIAGSYTNDNTYEFAFVASAPSTGTYTIYISSWRFSDPAGWTYMGVAWNRQ